MLRGLNRRNITVSS